MPSQVMVAQELLKRAADRTTDWHFHCWYWGDAIVVDGLLEAQEALGDGRYRDHVLENLSRWHFRCLPNFDDVLAPGAALIGLVEAGNLPPNAAHRVLDALNALPLVHGAIPALEPHRPAFRFGVCIDAVYHLPSTYARAARWKDDMSLARKAVRIAVDGMRLLECPAGWSQWFDPTRKKNNGVAWSRGLGWAVLGLLDLVRLLDGRGTDEAADLAARVLERLAGTQGRDGNWPAVLDHLPDDTETSTAAFYIAAALHPAARSLLSLPPSALERATAAFERALSADGTYNGVTADVLPSWDMATYEHCPCEPSPWAQGVAVRAAAALARAGTARAAANPNR